MVTRLKLAVIYSHHYTSFEHAYNRLELKPFQLVHLPPPSSFGLSVVVGIIYVSWMAESLNFHPFT